MCPRPCHPLLRRALPALLVLPALLLGACDFLGGSTSQQETAPPAPVDWRLAGAFPADLPLLGEAGTRLAERIGRLSGGRITLRYTPPGEEGPAPLELFDAVSAGEVDAAWSLPGYWVDRMPAASLFGGAPFGPPPQQHFAWLHEGGGLALWRELYGAHDVVPTPCAALPQESSGWFREPVPDAEALRGRKVRYYGLAGRVLQKLGASVHPLASGDIVAALERGVLDGAEVSVPSLDRRQGLPGVARNVYFPGWHQPVTVVELIVNAERWEALEPSQRELIETACRASLLTTLERGERQQVDALSAMRQQGVRVRYWPGAMLEAFRQAWEEVVREQSGRDETFAEVYGALQAFRERTADWRELTRLPEGG